MNLYKMYDKKLISVKVKRETKFFYFIEKTLAAFDYCHKVDKKKALLTPEQAIQESLNINLFYQESYKKRLIDIEDEIKSLKNLQKKRLIDIEIK